MNTTNLSFGLVLTTVILLIVSTATSYWGCGNILIDCHQNAGIVAAKVFFMLGLVCCIVVLILEIIGLCSILYRSNATLNCVRLVLLGIGIGSLIICLLIYTSSSYSGHWGYMAAVIAMTLGLQALIIGMMTSSCTMVTRSSGGHVVVRHTVVTH